MKIYNKLVRNNVPKIMKQEGKKCVIKILEDDEYKQALLKKIVEEAAEMRESKGDSQELIKEVGDIEEVLESIISVFGLNAQEIERIKKERKNSRGGFDKKIFLESAE